MARRPTLRQQIDALLTLFGDNIRDSFLAAFQDITDRVILSDLTREIQRGDAEAAFRVLGFSDAAMRPITAQIEAAFEQGGNFTASTYPKRLRTANGRGVFRFDVRNSRAEAWLRDHSSQLVTRLSEDTRNNVRNVLEDGMQRGSNPRVVALDIAGRIDNATGHRVGGIVGLSQQQEGWVRNTRRDLEDLDPNYFSRELRDKRFDRIVQRAIDKGEPLDRETITKLVDRYKDKALKYRAEMIARTEALQSLNRAEYESAKQAVDIGAVRLQDVSKHWDSAGDTRVRYTHSAMDHKYEKQGVGLDEPFVSPSGARMLHPGDTSLGAPADEIIACRCRQRIAIDWFANVD